METSDTQTVAIASNPLLQGLAEERASSVSLERLRATEKRACEPRPSVLADLAEITTADLPAGVVSLKAYRQTKAEPVDPLEVALAEGRAQVARLRASLNAEGSNGDEPRVASKIEPIFSDPMQIALFDSQARSERLATFSSKVAAISEY